MNRLPNWNGTVAHARVIAINRSKPNPNICLGYIIYRLEKVVYGLNPI